eukprot:612249-Pelagomonas_calceolata.AAC.2
MADFMYMNDFLCGHQISKTGKTGKPEPNEIMSMQLHFLAQFRPKLGALRGHCGRVPMFAGHAL